MGPDNDPTTNEVLAVSSRRDGRRVVVQLVGELDLHGSDRLTDEVTQALSDPIDVLDLDARGLRFVDSAGLRALLLARGEAERKGVSFQLSEVTPPVNRVIDLAGLGDLLGPSA
jgi:stage II sporulation protein AA (anti-sigma F factor antagonist)